MDYLDHLRRSATLPIPAAGKILGMHSPSTAYRAARDGSLPTLQVGRRRVVPTAALLRMLGLEAEAIMK